MLEHMLGMFFSRSPAALEWLSAVGQEYENRGFLRGAEWIFRQVVRTGGPSSKAYYHLGRVLYRRGRLEEARHSYARSLEIKPDFYLCRLGFFELCRQEYWRFVPTVPNAPVPGVPAPTPLDVSPATPSEGTDDPAFSPPLSGFEVPPGSRPVPSMEGPETRLRQLHQHVAEGILPLMRSELARLDEGDVEISIYDRLLASQGILKLSKRQARLQAQQLERAGEAFEQARHTLQALQPSFEASRGRVARITPRKKPPFEVVGLRDSDDLVSYHLEYISGGQLTFIALDKVRSVEFGLTSEFTEATLRLIDGTMLRVVMPSLYYGSLDSGHPELQRGEFTLFKELFPGIRVGIGRRVFTCARRYTAEPMALAFQDIQKLEFLESERLDVT